MQAGTWTSLQPHGCSSRPPMVPQSKLINAGEGAESVVSAYESAAVSHPIVAGRFAAANGDSAPAAVTSGALTGSERMGEAVAGQAEAAREGAMMSTLPSQRAAALRASMCEFTTSPENSRREFNSDGRRCAHRPPSPPDLALARIAAVWTGDGDEHSERTEPRLLANEWCKGDEATEKEPSESSVCVA
eukprot:scaffold64749_cov28-Tisochrysis_lutea.AAC.5